MDRPLVGIFSDPNALALSLLENFLANFCSVVVFSRKTAEWQALTAHIKGTPHFLIKDKPSGVEKLNYAFIVSLSLRDSFEETTRGASGILKNFGAKTFAVLDYRKFTPHMADALTAFGVGVIYVTDLMGPRMDLDPEKPLGRIIGKALNHKSIPVSSEEKIYPISIGDTAKALVKWAFSFGPAGEETLIASSPISSREFSVYLLRYLPEAKFSDRNITSAPLPRVNLYSQKTDVPVELGRTIQWFTSFAPVSPVSPNDSRVNRSPVKINRRIWLAAFGIILLLASPYLLLGMSLGAMALGAQAVLSGSYETPKGLFRVGKGMAQVSRAESGFFSNVPLAGRIYGPSLVFSEVAVGAGSLAGEGLTAGAKTKLLVAGILGDSDYDLAGLSDGLGSDLDAIYSELSFLQGDLDSSTGLAKQLTEKYLTAFDIARYKEKAFYLKEIVKYLPGMLGGDKKKTYLVLLQNNMELRPTGGFIGSFAQVSFEKGKLTDINVSDVYSPDGQLKGHVEPPAPIKNYLGEAGWYLRDSNWDPDFPTSAAKAEWFLNKEIDQSYDGVVGMDLEAVRLLLKEFGPIKVTDYDLYVDYNNLYETTQREVEEGFFPGSTKKANFLTALSRDLLVKVSDSQENNYVGLGKVFFAGFEERHFQAFLHEPGVQSDISALGWDGAVPSPVCAGNCLPDWLGLVEANVGVNKANYFIARRPSLLVSFDGGKIKKELSIVYENTANPALGDAGKYKTYLRVLAPSGAVFGDIGIYSTQGSETKTPEISELHGRVESGVLFTVSPGETIKVVVAWDESGGLKFNQKGEYRLLWRKQAGTVADNIAVNIYLPTSTLTKIQPTPSLTRTGVIRYNSNLSRDFVSRLYW